MPRFNRDSTQGQCGDPRKGTEQCPPLSLEERARLTVNQQRERRRVNNKVLGHTVSQPDVQGNKEKGASFSQATAIKVFKVYTSYFNKAVILFLEGKVVVPVSTVQLPRRLRFNIVVNS